MKTTLLEQDKDSCGQACRGPAGNLTMQTPRNQTTDAKALHTNKAHVLPVLLVGTFEEERWWVLQSTRRPELQILYPLICCCPPGW